MGGEPLTIVQIDAPVDWRESVEGELQGARLGASDRGASVRRSAGGGRFDPQGRAGGAICLDCDALDPLIMAVVIAPMAGGLSYGQGLGLIRAVAARGQIVSFEMLEFTAARDRDGEGARTAAQLLT